MSLVNSALAILQEHAPQYLLPEFRISHGTELATVVLTRAMIEAGRSRRGGFNGHQLRVFGFNGFERRWKKRLTGRLVPLSQYEAFLALKDSHLPKIEEGVES